MTPASRRAALIAVIIAAGIGGAVAVSAQTTASGRFTMHPVEGGVLRLDTQSGTMSMCRDKTGQWACETLPDERAALEKEIERLTTENRDLYGSIKKLEEIAGVPDAKPKASVQLPTEEDVDKAMSYIQRMFKKFREKLKEFEEPDGKQTQRL
jgi:hypothetical protein